MKIKMAMTVVAVAQCVFLFEETKCVTLVQHKFRTHCSKNPFTGYSVLEWQKSFVTTGCCWGHSKKTASLG